MKHECDKDIAIDMIREDLSEIKKDVKDLLAFRWQLAGIAIAVSAFVSIGIKVASAFIK